MLDYHIIIKGLDKDRRGTYKGACLFFAVFPMIPKYFKSLHILRGLGMVVIMLCHLSAMEDKYTVYRFMQPVWNLGNFVLDLFFMLSGFVILFTSWDSLHKGFAGWRVYMLRRFIRVYPVYWIVCSVSLLLYWLIPGTARPHMFEWEHIVRSYTLISQEAWPITLVAWTLVLEVFFYLVFSVGYFVPRKLLWVGAVVWAAFVFAMNTWWPDEGNAYASVFHTMFALEFMAGAFMAWLVFTYPALIVRWRKEMAGLCVFWLVAVYFALPLLGEYWRVIWFGGIVFFLFLACIGYEMHRPALFARRRLVLLGDASYSLYLTHLMVMNGLVLVVQTLWDSQFVAVHVVLGAGILAGCMVYGMVHYMWLERPLLRAARRYCGV